MRRVLPEYEAKIISSRPVKSEISIAQVIGYLF